MTSAATSGRYGNARAYIGTLVEYVMRVVEPLFMLFDFKKFDRKVYEEIVNNFAAGRIT